MSTSRDKLGQALRLREVYAACLCVMLGVAPAYAQPSGNTSLGNFQVQAGNAAIAAGADPKNVVINLSNSKSVLQWDRLNVPIGATLQFSQPNAQSVVLNRVVSVDPARIDGVMNSNGQVWILSGSGVLFGKDSQVNVQGLMASTRDISNADFLASKYTFSGGGSGKVSNLGELTVADGGYVLLVGSEVDNQGRIQAQLGQVKLASGKAFVLDLNGDRLLRFDVTEALTGGDGQAARVSNAGQIVADGGTVQMTARAANGLVAQVVNTGGLLQANSARMVNGQIVLDAGPGGEVVAGGQISTQGLDAGATGGSVTVVGDKITLSSDSRINASGQAGGGTVLVGGDWQGSGSLQQASVVDMQAGAEIKANATLAGDGGKVVLWSDIQKQGGSTTVAGAIQAKGGVNAGAGGNVETSGHVLNISESANVNAAGANGQAGNWLLDPVTVTIDTAAAGVIQTALGGSNVMVTTNGAAVSVATFTNTRVGESVGAGDITVNAPITWSNNTLSLHADGNITVNSILTYSSGSTGGLDLHVGYKNAGNPMGTPPDYNANKYLTFGRDSLGFTGKFNVSSDGHFRLNSNDYQVISNLTQLQNINTNKSGRFALATDINAAGSSSLNGGAGFVPLGDSGAAFTGSFIGLGHTISGLVINRPTEDYVGLFGNTNGAQISNVGLINASISGRGAVGGVSGVMKNGELRNSYLQSSNVTALGKVNGDVNKLAEVGGLVGHLEVDDANTSKITNNSYAGSVTATTGGGVGGLLGLLIGGNVNYGDILIQNNNTNVSVSSASDMVGGFIGNIALYGAVRVNVFDNYSKGSVTGPGGVGGFLGSTDLNACFWGCPKLPGKLNVNRNYSTASVTGTNGVGGFGGSLWSSYSDSTFQNNYATGNVTVGAGQTGGGFIGYNQVTQLNSYATGTVTGGSTVGGLIGNNWADLTGLYWSSASSGQANGIGTNSGGNLLISNLSAVQLKKQSNFNGFDFSSASAPWTIYEGYTAPLLKSFLSPLTVTVGSPTVATKVYDGTTSYAGSGSVSYSVVPGASLLGTLGYSTAAKNVGSQQIQVGGLYSDQQGYLISYVNNMGSVNVTPAALTVTASTVTKTYDGTTTATGSGTTASLAGAGAGETLFAAPQVFTDKNAGTGKKVQVTSATVKDSGGADVTGNYNITYVDDQASVINQALLQVTATSVTKTYDGDRRTTATPTIGSLAGAGAGDTIDFAGVQSFLDKNVGVGKTVRASGVTVKDVNNQDVTTNYDIRFADNTTSVINRAALTVTAGTVIKTYDGTTAAAGTAAVGALAGAGAGEVVASAGTQSFTDKNAGTGKTVQASGVTIKDRGNADVTSNYNITYVDDQASVINQAVLSVTGTTVANKTYDGTTTAALSNGSLVGVIAGDVGNVSLTQAGTFADKNVGTTKVVTAADTLGGSEAGNYTLTQPTGLAADIAAKALTVTGTTVANKTYDGTTTATLSNGSLVGVVAGDVSNVSLSQAGAFADKNVGANKVVTAADTLAGSEAGNYTLTQPTGLAADIAAKALTVTGTTVANKTYDGTITAALSNGSLVGVVAGDVGNVSLSQAGAFADKNVGTNKVVTASNSIGGTESGNYTLTQPTGLAADIAAKALTVTGTTVANKTYDGTTTAALSNGSLVGVVAGDVGNVSLSQAGAFADKNVGTNKVVTASNSIGGTESGNYTLTQPTGLAADIAAKALTVTGTTVANKTYDGTTTAALSNGSLVGVVAGDVGNVSLTQAGTFADKNVGANKVVTAADTLAGSEAGNYTLTQPTGLAADIGQATLTLAAVSDTKTFDTTAASSKIPTVSGLQAGDSVTNRMQKFDSAVVGLRTLSVDNSFVVNDGNSGNNYAVTLQTANGAINAAPVATQTVQATASQSVQIAVASATSSLTQLSAETNTTAATEISPQKITTATAVATNPSTSAAGTTSTATTTTASTTVTGQSGTTTATPVVNATTTTETASISVSNQAAPTANLNAPNTATVQTQTTAATGTAATEVKPQVTMVSMTALNVNTPTSVGVQTIAAIATPTAPEDQRDPVLAAVSSFKPPAVLSATSGRSPAAKGQNQPVVVPLVQGVLALETVPPKAASQTVDEQRLSGAGNRSRW